jgi:two-component system, cell cycle response regulator DivK
MTPSSPSILIVDDHADCSAMYQQALSMMGYRAVTASNAVDALARACDAKVDAIVADVILPGMSGVELARRLRGDGRTKDAAIILLTGSTSTSIRKEADDAGCDRFLLKPCLPETLATIIQDVLALKGCEDKSPPHRRSSSTPNRETTTDDGIARPTG